MNHFLHRHSTAIRCIAAVSALTVLAAAACTPEDEETTGGTETSSASGGAGGAGGEAVGGMGGSGGSTQTWDCDEQHDIGVTTSYGEVEHCGEFFIPHDNDSDAASLQIFSSGMETITIVNDSDREVVIERVEVAPHDGVMSEEFQIRSGDTSIEPIVIEDQPIAAGESFSFTGYFFPLEGSKRSADVSIVYDDGRVFGLTLSGHGHPKQDPDTARFSEDVTLDWHRLFGGFGDSQDEQGSGIALDQDGNMFFAGASKTLLEQDMFYYDLIYGRINADGSLGWYKIWGTDAVDKMPDAGENNQAGSPKAVVTDDNGDVYVMGAVGVGSTATTTFATLVMKLDGETGDILWETFWHPKWSRVIDGNYTDSGLPYAMHYHAGRVYLTGVYSTNDDGGAVPATNGGLFAIALDAGDGALAWQKHVDPAPDNGTVDRGYAIAATGPAGSESVLIGGWTGESGINNTFMTKLDCTASDCTIGWQKTYDYHYGARINNVAVDASGDAYVSLDNADYSASFMKVSGADGSVVWAKELDDIGNGAPQVSTDAVYVDGDSVYFGGILKASWYDTQMGDAWVAKLGTDGTVDWMSFYFSGKGPATICNHKVRGIALSGDQLYLGGSVYTGNSNYYRYWGYWYEGTRDVVDATITTQDQADTVIETIATGGMMAMADLQALTGAQAAKVSNITSRHFGEQITDYPNDPDAPRPIELWDAADKNAETFGAATDKDLMFWKLSLP